MKKIIIFIIAVIAVLGLSMRSEALVNHAPRAYAGADSTVLSGGVGFLDGTGSFDIDGDPLFYFWVQRAGPRVALTKISPGVVVTSPLTAQSNITLSFALRVFDGRRSSTDIVNITIKAANTAPVAAAGIDQIVSAGSLVSLDGSGSYDADGDLLNYQWTQVAGTPVAVLGGNGAVGRFAAPAVLGSLTFRLVVGDGMVSSQDEVTIFVEPINQEPIANAGHNLTVAGQKTVTLDATGSIDPDGDPLTFDWLQIGGPSVILDLANPAMPTFTAPDPIGEPIIFELLVDDGRLTSLPVTVEVFVVDPLVDPPNCFNAYLVNDSLWPPDHKLLKVEMRGIVPDEEKRTSLLVTSATSDEAVSGLGTGDSSPDTQVSYKTEEKSWGIRTKTKIYLRRERDANGNGRVYAINFDAVNEVTGLSCSGTVWAEVPLVVDVPAIDNGQLHDVLLP